MEDQGKFYKLKTEIVGRLLKVVDLVMAEKTITSQREAEMFSRVATLVQLAKTIDNGVDGIKNILEFYGIVKKVEKK